MDKEIERLKKEKEAIDRKIEELEKTESVFVNGWDVTEFEKWYNEEFCLEAVKRNSYSLRYVKEQTKELCLEAVKQNRYALQYVNKKVFK